MEELSSLSIVIPVALLRDTLPVKVLSPLIVSVPSICTEESFISVILAVITLFSTGKTLLSFNSWSTGISIIWFSCSLESLLLPSKFCPFICMVNIPLPIASEVTKPLSFSNWDKFVGISVFSANSKFISSIVK